jgi:hypothetical protein
VTMSRMFGVGMGPPRVAGRAVPGRIVRFGL